MTEREKKVLNRLAVVLPYMTEAMKERLLGYGDAVADMYRLPDGRRPSAAASPAPDRAAARPGA